MRGCVGHADAMRCDGTVCSGMRCNGRLSDGWVRWAGKNFKEFTKDNSHQRVDCFARLGQDKEKEAAGQWRLGLVVVILRRGAGAGSYQRPKVNKFLHMRHLFLDGSTLGRSGAHGAWDGRRGTAMTSLGAAMMGALLALTGPRCVAAPVF